MKSVESLPGGGEAAPASVTDGTVSGCGDLFVLTVQARMVTGHMKVTEAYLRTPEVTEGKVWFVP